MFSKNTKITPSETLKTPYLFIDEGQIFHLFGPLLSRPFDAAAMTLNRDIVPQRRLYIWPDRYTLLGLFGASVHAVKGGS